MEEDNGIEGLKGQKRKITLECTKKEFIICPADIDIHRKVDLQDAEVTEEQQNALKELCDEYKDIFPTDSSDIGKPPLIEMEIDTSDSLPIIQRAYTLPSKHVTWGQKDSEILEKAGVIVRTVSPWVSPIVKVP